MELILNMTKKIFIKTILVWFLLAFLATVNGSVRNFLYKPWVGDLVAHWISTFVFVVVIFLVTYWAFCKNLSELSDQVLLSIGFIWVLFTEAFEFLAGHYLFGNSWDKLLADYNLLAGRLWLLVVLATFFSPYLVGYFFRKK